MVLRGKIRRNRGQRISSSSRPCAVHFVRRKVDAAVWRWASAAAHPTNVCRPRSRSSPASASTTPSNSATRWSPLPARRPASSSRACRSSAGHRRRAREVIRQAARRNGCRLVELGVDFDFSYEPPCHVECAASPAHIDFRYGSDSGEAGERFHYDHAALGLLGRHQAANAAVAMAALEELRRRVGTSGGGRSPRTGRGGLAAGGSGRPAAHGGARRRPQRGLHRGADEVLAESFSARRWLLIFATTQDKDLRGHARPLAWAI